MPLPAFDYLSPRTLDEASALLRTHGDDAMIIAGGTNVLVHLQGEDARPGYLIGLQGIPGLTPLGFDPTSGLTLGAMTTLADAAGSVQVRTHYPALAGAANVAATVQIRNRATVVGNLCNASPCADTAVPLLAYEATVVTVGLNGTRLIPLDQFFRGPGATALERDHGELVRAITVPPCAPRTGAAFERLSSRSTVDIAAASVCALMTLDADGVATTVRIALGSVAPTPRRAHEAEDRLQGSLPTDSSLREAARLAAAASAPITDMRASLEYRRQMVEVLTLRALRRSHASATERR